MNKLMCQICGGELSSETGITLSVCGKCGTNVQLPIENAREKLNRHYENVVQKL